MRPSRAEKTRQPDNLPTWSVIIGCLLGVLFVLGSAYSQRALAGLLVFIVIVAYILVLSFVGRVNVLRILWGGTISDEDEQANRPVVVYATTGMAFTALLWWVWDRLSADSWGWFSWIGAVVALVYIAMVLRDARTSTKEQE